MSMLKDHFVIISIKNSSSLSKIKVSNNVNESNSYANNEIVVNLGKPMEVTFIDDDVFLIKSNDVEIRIDIDLTSIEQSINNFRSEKHV